MNEMVCTFNPCDQEECKEEQHLINVNAPVLSPLAGSIFLPKMQVEVGHFIDGIISLFICVCACVCTKLKSRWRKAPTLARKQDSRS